MLHPLPPSPDAVGGEGDGTEQPGTGHDGCGPWRAPDTAAPADGHDEIFAARDRLIDRYGSITSCEADLVQGRDPSVVVAGWPGTASTRPHQAAGSTC